MTSNQKTDKQSQIPLDDIPDIGKSVEDAPHSIWLDLFCPEHACLNKTSGTEVV